MNQHGAAFNKKELMMSKGLDTIFCFEWQLNKQNFILLQEVIMKKSNED